MQNCKTPEKIRHCDRSVGASVGGASGCGAADTGIQQQLLGKRNLRFTHRVKGGAFANSFSACLMCDASTLLLKKKTSFKEVWCFSEPDNGRFFPDFLRWNLGTLALSSAVSIFIEGKKHTGKFES